MVKDGLDDTISIRGNEGTMQGQTQEKALTFLKTKSSFVVVLLTNDDFVKMNYQSGKFYL